KVVQSEPAGCSKLPSSAVTLWKPASRTQVTVWPTWMVISRGSNTLLPTWTITADGVGVGVAVDVTPGGGVGASAVRNLPQYVRFAYDCCPSLDKWGGGAMI
ncbi:MAG: hypothetical protein D6694_14450, partial [Gammaproteobacteria bacterium]